MSTFDRGRRRVLKTGAIAGAGLAMPTIFTSRSASAFMNQPTGSTVVLGFNFLGDGLRDALDPRLRGE